MRHPTAYTNVIGHTGRFVSMSVLLSALARLLYHAKSASVTHAFRPREFGTTSAFYSQALAELFEGTRLVLAQHTEEVISKDRKVKIIVMTKPPNL